MEELEEIIQKMMDENTPEEEIKNYIKDYKEGKLNGAAEKDATATPETSQASENMELESENYSSELYDRQQAVFTKDNLKTNQSKDKEQEILKEPKFTPDTNFSNNYKKYKELKLKETNFLKKITPESSSSFFGTPAEKIYNQKISDANKQVQFDIEASQKEINKFLINNPKFSNQLSAIKELQNDNNNTRSTGKTKDAFQFFGQATRFFGKLLNVGLESQGLTGVPGQVAVDEFLSEKPNQQINLNIDVLSRVVGTLDKKQLQRLSSGNYNLQEKEQLIAKARIETYKQGVNKASKLADELNENYKSQFEDLSLTRDTLENELKGLKKLFENPEYLTEENINKYNSYVEQYGQLSDKSKTLKKNYSLNIEKITNERDELSARYNIDIVNDMLSPKTAFEATKESNEYAQSFSKEGWWNATRDFTNTTIQGVAQTLGKIATGIPQLVFSTALDPLTEDNEYSSSDELQDALNNLTNYSLLPVADSEEFDVLNKEGKFKNPITDSRSYVKQLSLMLPYTLALMNEIRKGNISTLGKGMGKTLNGLKTIGKPQSVKLLSKPNQAIKDFAIGAEASFAATYGDNYFEAKEFLNDSKARSYALQVTLAEGASFAIMNPANFFKGSIGKQLKNQYIKNLALATNYQAVKQSGFNYTKNLLAEAGQEEFVYGTDMLTKVAYGLALPNSTDFIKDQRRLINGVVSLSSTLGSVGARKSFKDTKTAIIQEFLANSNSIELQLEQMIDISTNREFQAQIRKAQLYASDIRQAGKNAPLNVTGEEIELLVQLKRLLDDKKSTDPAYHGEINEQITFIEEKIKKSKINRTQEKRSQDFDKNLTNLANDLDADVFIVDGEEKVIDEINKLKEKGVVIDEKASENYGTFFTYASGDKKGKQGIVINKKAEEEGGLRTTLLHEVGHLLLLKTFKKNPDSALKVASSLRNQLFTNAKFNNSDYQNRVLDYQADLLKGEIDPEVYFEETITLAIEGIENGSIDLNENTITKLQDIFRRLMQRVGLTIKFNNPDGSDVINFIKDYKRFAATGKGGKALKEAAKKGIKGELTDLSKEQKDQLAEDEKAIRQSGQFFEQETKKSQRKNQEIYKELQKIDEFEADFMPNQESKNRKQELLQELNQTETKSSLKKQPTEKQKIASAAVQKLFEEKPRDWEGKVIQLYKPITGKLVEMRRFKHDDFNVYKDELLSEIENSDRGILGLIRRYDPERNDSLAAFISQNLPRRMMEVDEKIFPKGFTKQIDEQRTDSAQDSDITIEDSIDESITPTKQEELNLRKKIKLPDEQVEKVRDAVRKTFGTRLPKVKSPEFKKALRKAYDTELFKELKTNVFKTRDEYKSFLRENWKALYDAIPQETLNQSFAPFREEVLDESGKQKREKTPEGERIFRKKNITREEFLDYFFNPNVGGSTRGTRKDAIVRMLAQELGFDATMETIQEPKVAEKIAFANPTVTVPIAGVALNRADEKVFFKIKELILTKEYGWQNTRFIKLKSIDDVEAIYS